MRDIQFRGKRVDNGEWVYGYYVFYGHMGVFKHIIITNWAQVYTNSFYVETNTVGQYTGLKDKNGQEIYEGDVIQEFAGEHAQGVWEYFNVSIVEDLRWLPDSLDFADCAYVIGNIYDNPELMEMEE